MVAKSERNSGYAQGAAKSPCRGAARRCAAAFGLCSALGALLCPARQTRRLFLCAVASLGLAAPLGAHPHIFVDTELELVFAPDGQPEGIWISWAYDPFFSMLLVSDMGLDPDFTGDISEAERAELDGFDMNWIEGYHGDTHVTQGGRALALSGPVEWVSDYREGQLFSRHLRRFEDRPDPAQELVIAVYDPTYYTSYGLVGMPQITGRGDCLARIYEPDWEAAGAQLEAALDEMLGAGGDMEADFPAVGALFAEEVRILCPAP